MYVPCGVCPACQQVKANARMSRILSHAPKDYVPLFFHLTYAPDYLPYFYVDDLSFPQGSTPSQINIYRNSSVQWFYNRHKNVYTKVYDDNEKYLDTYFYDMLVPSWFDKLQILEHNKVGVLFYHDIQNFFKRLRINYERYKSVYSHIFREGAQLSYFVAGEYGTRRQRPHWHIIMYVPKHDTKYLWEWKRLISRSWLFALQSLTFKNVEYAISAASYASDYVNCSSNVSPLLQKGDFRPVWHFSHNFGFDFEGFSLSSLLFAIQKNDLSFTRTSTNKAGVCCTRRYNIPSYVTNRWFPPFKGFHRLNYEEITRLICNPFEIYGNGVSKEHTRTKWLSPILRKLGYPYDYTHEDARKFIELVSKKTYQFQKAVYDASFNINHNDTFVEIPKDLNLGNVTLMRQQYAFWYVRFLQAKNSTLFKLQYTFNKPSDYVQHYYNICDYTIAHRTRGNPLTSSYHVPKRLMKYVVNPNDFEDVVSKTHRLTEQFNNKIKHRNINQICQNL